MTVDTEPLNIRSIICAAEVKRNDVIELVPYSDVPVLLALGTERILCEHLASKLLQSVSTKPIHSTASIRILSKANSWCGIVQQMLSVRRNEARQLHDCRSFMCE